MLLCSSINFKEHLKSCQHDHSQLSQININDKHNNSLFKCKRTDSGVSFKIKFRNIHTCIGNEDTISAATQALFAIIGLRWRESALDIAPAWSLPTGYETIHL